VVISAGGCFMKKPGSDRLEYQGGETRLVSLPGQAVFQDLLDSLDRVTGGSITSASSIGLGQARASLLLGGGGVRVCRGRLELRAHVLVPARTACMHDSW